MIDRVVLLLRVRFQLRQAVQLLDAELDEVAMPKPYPTGRSRLEVLLCTLGGAQDDLRAADEASQKVEGAS